MYVYILRCDNGSLYTGITADILRRIRQHLGMIAGGAKYTRAHRVIFIEALWEAPSDTAARKLEFALKKLTHIQKEKLILQPETITEKFCISLNQFKYICTDISHLNKDFCFSKEMK